MFVVVAVKLLLSMWWGMTISTLRVLDTTNTTDTIIMSVCVCVRGGNVTSEHSHNVPMTCAGR